MEMFAVTPCNDDQSITDRNVELKPTVLVRRRLFTSPKAKEHTKTQSKNPPDQPNPKLALGLFSTNLNNNCQKKRIPEPLVPSLCFSIRMTT